MSISFFGALGFVLEYDGCFAFIYFLLASVGPLGLWVIHGLRREEGGVPVERSLGEKGGNNSLIRVDAPTGQSDGESSTL